MSTWHWRESALSLILYANVNSMLDRHYAVWRSTISAMCVASSRYCLSQTRITNYKWFVGLRGSWDWQTVFKVDREWFYRYLNPSGARPTILLGLESNVQVGHQMIIVVTWAVSDTQLSYGTATFYSFIQAGAPHTRLDVSPTRSLAIWLYK